MARALLPANRLPRWCQSELASPLFTETFEVARIRAEIPRSTSKAPNQTGMAGQFIGRLTRTPPEVALQRFSDNFRLRTALHPGLLFQAFAERLGNSDRDTLRRHSWMSDVKPNLSGTCRHSFQAPYTIFPPTIVATTLPVSCHPSNGVFLDLESDFAASKVHFFLGSKMVTSPK